MQKGGEGVLIACKIVYVLNGRPLILIVTNHVNWHREGLQSDRENTGNLKKCSLSGDPDVGIYKASKPNVNANQPNTSPTRARGIWLRWPVFRLSMSIIMFFGFG